MSKTSSFQRLGTAGLAALAVVGLLSGCAAKKKTAATSSTASTAAAAAPAATSAAGAPAASAAPSKVVATGGGKFCKEVAAAVNDTTKNPLSGGGADSLKQSVQNFKSIEGSVLSSAPKEIKSDLATLFGALDPFYAALEKNNYDFTKIDPSIGSTLDTPAVKAATDHVDAYIKNTCGIDTGGGDTGTGDSSAAAASASAALASALAKLTASPAG